MPGFVATGAVRASLQRDACLLISMNSDNEDTTTYHVVVNGEEQYSIWPGYKAIPAGWREAGKSGLKQECLDYIKTVWTDMRPLSLRRQMDADSA